MSSEDDECFVGEEGQLHDGHDVVADLEGPADGQEEDEEGGDEEPEAHDDVQDDALHNFTGHTGSVLSVACSPSSEAVATGGADDKIYLWKALDPSGASQRLDGHTDTVASLRFNTAGTLLASGGLDGKVGIWEADTGRCRHALEGPDGAIEWLDWHPRGDLILAGSEDFTTWLWNAQTGAFMAVFTGHAGSVRCGRFTPDGKGVVTGGGEDDATLRAWDPKTGACSATIEGAHFHTVGLTALDVYTDSATVLTGAEDGSAFLSNIQSGRILGQLQGHTDSIESIQMSAGLPYSATASVDGKLIIWDNSTLSIRATCTHPEAVVKVLLHPSEPFAYTACLDGVVRCWDARSGVCLQQRTGHTEGVQDLALNRDGSLVLTGSDDNSARMFDFRS